MIWPFRCRADVGPLRRGGESHNTEGSDLSWSPACAGVTWGLRRCAESGGVPSSTRDPRRTQFGGCVREWPDRRHLYDTQADMAVGAGGNWARFVIFGDPTVAVLLRGPACRFWLIERGRPFQGADVECGCPYRRGRSCDQHQSGGDLGGNGGDVPSFGCGPSGSVLPQGLPLLMPAEQRSTLIL